MINRRAVLVCLAIALAGGALVTAIRTRGRDQQAPAPQRTIAITVDDLPGAIPFSDEAVGELTELERINRAISSTLRAHHVPGTGFVNEGRLQVPGERDARAALLQMWLDAGMTLGNHTYSHLSFQTTPLERFEDDVIRGDVVTRTLMAAAGQMETYFRHPYLQTGPTPEDKAAFETFLKERGYRVAPVTIDSKDWMFNAVLGAAGEGQDPLPTAKVQDAYLEFLDVSVDYFEGVSRSLFGREIPQVLLLHDNAINADVLDAVLTKLDQRGYRFVSLDEALTDPAYATRDTCIGSRGISWLSRWSITHGQRVDDEQIPAPPKWISRRCTDLRRINSR